MSPRVLKLVDVKLVEFTVRRVCIFGFRPHFPANQRFVFIYFTFFILFPCLKLNEELNTILKYSYILQALGIKIKSRMKQ